MTANIARGCGSRVKGGLYACCATSPYGEFIEFFLIDPPVPYEGKSFRAPIVEGSNLIFWVGEKFYPYCPDFIEEARYFGVSKRIPIGELDLRDFKPFQTKMLFIHPRAVADTLAPTRHCPKNDSLHFASKERCIGPLYFFIKPEDVETESSGVLKRTIGSTVYTVPKLINGAKLTPGYFMWLPFSHFEYVRQEDGSVDARIEKAVKSGVNILYVED
ncbi:MAG: hypothetical protein A2X93_04845 [Deltaproteobacteria bacterium GWC2_56_8]|nr:MAG: hypothetical protein A2X93_04845 [Deltaproteobacteria bacterium GWC2_56_8]